MSRCYALTAKGRPCRQYASIQERTDEEILYSPTCSKHTGTFDSSWWKGEYMIGTEAKGKYLEYYSVRRNHVEAVLRDGVVTLGRHEIAGIPAFARWTSFFHFAARYTPGFCMTWNPELWTVAARTLWKWCYSIGPIYMSICSILTIAKHKTNRILPFYSLLLTYPHETQEEYQYSKEKWVTFFSMYLNALEPVEAEQFLLDQGHPEQERLLLDALKKIRHPPLFLYLEEGVLSGWLEEKKRALLEEKQSTVRMVKDELVATAWAPERVLDWCVDEEEKKGVLGRWPAMPFPVAMPYTSLPA